MADNVKMSVKGDVLTIEVNLKHRGDLSTSGKTISIASTGGNVKLDGPHANISVGLNVMTKDGAPEAKAAAIKAGRTFPA